MVNPSCLLFAATVYGEVCSTSYQCGARDFYSLDGMKCEDKKCTCKNEDSELSYSKYEMRAQCGDILNYMSYSGKYTIVLINVFSFNNFCLLCMN